VCSWFEGYRKDGTETAVQSTIQLFLFYSTFNWNRDKDKSAVKTLIDAFPKK
jgi:hypothetical protein